MPASVSLYITDSSGRSSTDLAYLKPQSGNNLQAVNNLQNYLGGFGNAGAYTLRIDVAASAPVAATGTVTMASVQAGDTVSVNGVAFTAVSGAPSGNQFDISGTNAAAATSLVTQFNASATALITGMATASAASAVVTFTSTVPGLIGNAQTLASSNGTRLAVSGARLAGGTGGSSASGPTAFNYGL